MAIKQPSGGPGQIGPQNILVPTLPAPVPVPQAISSGVVETAGVDALIARPVLGRDPSVQTWAIVLPLNATLSSQIFREAYADLGIKAGIRGAVITQTAAVAVTLRQNFNGATLTIPAGIGTYFLPLFMSTQGIDLTVTVASGNLSQITATLYTEEMVPAKVA